MLVSLFTTAGKREQNEDTIYPNLDQPAGSVFIIADGLGGHAGGQEASRLACETLARMIEKEDPFTFVLGAHRMTIDQVRRSFLSDCVRQTASVVYHYACQRRSDMATTLLAVWLVENQGYAAHIGDCALFVSEDGELPPTLLTQPHRRGVSLTRSLGSEEIVTPDLFSFRFDEDSVLVMGCDGFWEHVQPEQIAAILAEELLTDAAEALARAALAAGSDDNISVIVVAGERFAAQHSILSQSLSSPFSAHDSAAAFWATGWEALRQSDFYTAFQYFEQMLAVAPERAEALRRDLREWAGQQDLSEEWVEHYLALLPDEDDLRRRWAQLLSGHGELDQAWFHWRQLYRRLPEQRKTIASTLQALGLFHNSVLLGEFLALAEELHGPGFVLALTEPQAALSPAEIECRLEAVVRKWPLSEEVRLAALALMARGKSAEDEEMERLQQKLGSAQTEVQLYRQELEKRSRNQQQIEQQRNMYRHYALGYARAWLSLAEGIVNPSSISPESIAQVREWIQREQGG